MLVFDQLRVFFLGRCKREQAGIALIVDDYVFNVEERVGSMICTFCCYDRGWFGGRYDVILVFGKASE